MNEELIDTANAALQLIMGTRLRGFLCTLRYDGESPQCIIGLSFLNITVSFILLFPFC